MCGNPIPFLANQKSLKIKNRSFCSIFIQKQADLQAECSDFVKKSVCIARQRDQMSLRLCVQPERQKIVANAVGDQHLCTVLQMPA